MNKNMSLFKNKSILFAEDDAADRAFTEGLLITLFDKVYSALDGEEAYRIYKEKMPDIVLTDIRMPNMDGLTLIEKIRKDDYVIPIVVLSGFYRQEFVLRAVNLSVDAFLIKPLEFEKLTSSLFEVMRRGNTKSIRADI